MERMLSDLLSISRVELYLKFDHPVKQDHLQTLRTWIKRRLTGEPLAYITGKAEFFGLPLSVNPRVLIPRPETERVVEIALEKARDIRANRILDIGTGSGCIAVALARNLDQAQIVAIDQHDSVLKVARENARLNDVESKITFQKADIRSETPQDRFDLLVSNPPYIAEDELGELMDEVKRYEPVDALTDGGNGLELYRRIASQAREWIRPQGFAVMEVGLGSHPERVRKEFEKGGFVNIQVYQDYNGDDRVVVVKMSG